MTNDFDILKFRNLITDISSNYKLLRRDKTNKNIYEKEIMLLKELKEILDSNLLPNDLFGKTLNFYYQYYRVTEGTYLPFKNSKK